jgi:hypothetical protein
MEQQSIKSKIFQDLVKKGMPPIVAAGWVGNWDAETGGFKQMQEQNPISGQGGLGWGQWTGPRRQEFLDYANQNKLNPNSYDANFGNALREMEQGIHMPKGFTDYVAKNAKSPREAALLISQMAQRPAKGMEHNDLRMASAEELYASAQPAATPGGATPATPQVVRANQKETGEAPQAPMQPRGSAPMGDASGFMNAGFSGMSNPGFQDVSGYSDDRLQGLIGLLLSGAMGGQRSRKRVQ